MNKVMLIGRVGADPEVREMSNGGMMARFRLATRERWKNRDTGEREERTDWHTVVVFNAGLVTVVKNYVHKGTHLYVEGMLRERQYEHEGVMRRVSEVELGRFGSVIELLGGPVGSGVSGCGMGGSSGLGDPAVNNPSVPPAAGVHGSGDNFNTGSGVVIDGESAAAEDDIPF